MTSKLDKLFDDIQDEDGSMTLSRVQFEALANRYHLDKLSEPQKTHAAERLGFWILFGGIFLIGLFVGWKWEHSTICSSGTSYALSCLEN